MAIVHIYSEYPEYRWVDAAGEGIAALDDVARAALVYLDLYQRYADPAALERARLLLNFVMHLQAEDGEYYNFVMDRSGAINRQGRTSYKDWGWWAARGQWALARGFRILRKADPPYAARLRDHYLSGEEALGRILGNVGQYTDLHGTRLPSWFLKGGSDVTALALLSLTDFYAAEPNPKTRRLAFALGQAVAEYQMGDADDYPFGLRPSTMTSTAYWHAWGSHTVQALALAGQIFERQDWVNAARSEADLWFARLITTGMIREMGVIPRRYDQIAYAQSMLVLGYWNLYKATGEEVYRRLAGLAAAWFFGDNPAGVAMYDPETGRGYDGLMGASRFRVNYNSGAESTIEALWSLVQVADDPIASRYLRARPVSATLATLIEAEKATPTAGDPRYGQRDWTGEAYFSGGRYYALRPGDTLSVPFSVSEPGQYDLYVAHLRQAPEQRDLSVEAARATAPIQLDGDLLEWSQTELISVNARENILRGAAAWPGPETASFVAYFLWDEENLYVAAQVKDAQHVQESFGPDVWRGDALWVYLDTAGEGTRIDTKLTLAQTPTGPQVWNWVAGAFQPGAELAWREIPGGYIYEAAIPWRSMHRQPPQAGETLGFEVGMGFAGGFIDWTGTDPDTPSNLAPLTLVGTISVVRPTQASLDLGTAAIAIQVQLNSLEPIVLPELTSPDRSYLWLDRLLSGIELEAGDHQLSFAYAGLAPDEEAIVDAFWLYPVAARKVWELPETRKRLILEFDAHIGELSWQEE